MRWTAPPEKREIALVLFSVTAYLLAYNIETSLNYVGIDPVAAQGAFFRQIGLGKTKVIGRDGRKPPGWRDKLELSIFGSWAWDEGQIAGNGAERSQGKGTGRHGSQWLERKVARSFSGKWSGDVSVNDAYRWWMDEIPLVNVVKHVPGYTILDNVIVYKGDVYLVSDNASGLPPMNSIVETRGIGFQGWKVLSKAEGQKQLGKYGGIVNGVSWMSVSGRPSNTTLFDLWRMYSSLDPQIDSQGYTNLAPPYRIIFPHLPFFSDEDPPIEDHGKSRVRADTGFHPHLLKAAFPQMAVQYHQDWQDYHKMEVPFVFERLVVADRNAAGYSVNEGQPANSPPFGLEASSHWWEPVRRTLVSYFDRLDEEAEVVDSANKGLWSFKPKLKKVITFIDNHSDAAKRGQSVLIPGDYAYFSRSLNKLGRDKGYEVHIISTNWTDTPWEQRMDVIIRSTIVVGVHGDHLFDGVWMRPSAHTTLMELFPRKTFSRDRELTMSSLGIKYVAWWTDERFSSGNFPETTKESNEPVHINVDKIINEMHVVLSGQA